MAELEIFNTNLRSAMKANDKDKVEALVDSYPPVSIVANVRREMEAYKFCSEVFSESVMDAAKRGLHPVFRILQRAGAGIPMDAGYQITLQPLSQAEIIAILNLLVEYGWDVNYPVKDGYQTLPLVYMSATFSFNAYNSHQSHKKP